MKRILDCQSSDFRNISRQDLLDAIAGSEGRTIACETIEDGVKMALQEAGETGVVLCFGSLYTIGAIKEALDSI